MIWLLVVLLGLFFGLVLGAELYRLEIERVKKPKADDWLQIAKDNDWTPEQQKAAEDYWRIH